VDVAGIEPSVADHAGPVARDTDAGERVEVVRRVADVHRLEGERLCIPYPWPGFDPLGRAVRIRNRIGDAADAAGTEFDAATGRPEVVVEVVDGLVAGRRQAVSQAGERDDEHDAQRDAHDRQCRPDSVVSDLCDGDADCRAGTRPGEP
jgi:hypothetical protein